MTLAYSGGAGLNSASVSVVGPTGLLNSLPATVSLYGTGNILNPIGLPEAGTYTVYLIPSPNSTGTFTATLSAYGYGQPWPTTGPGAPPWIDGYSPTDSSVVLNWGAATDYSDPPSPIAYYNIYVGSSLFTAVTGTTATLTLSPGRYTFTVVAVDQANVAGPPSSTLWLDTLQNKPGVPTNLAGTSLSSSSIELTWTAAVDYSDPPLAIVGYDVYLGSQFEQTVSGTSVTITGLNASTTYAFTVLAVNADGAVGPASQAVWVTTQA